MSQFCVIFRNPHGQVAMVVEAESQEKAICEAVLHPSRDKSKPFDHIQAHSLVHNGNDPYSKALRALHNISYAIDGHLKQNISLDLPAIQDICNMHLNGR